MKHFKQPMMVGQSIRFCYRKFHKDSVIDLLQEQKEIAVRFNAAFDKNNILVQHDEYEEDDPLEALKAAERRGRQQADGRRFPKIRSSIVIEEGEGRTSREFEIQWWPSLYKTNFGKLSFRFFVNKVHL